VDCEKYDKISLDLLYDELDELTRAAAMRHVEQCHRCRAIHSELRATRSVGVLPLVEPPQGFEQRVILAEQRERANLPLGQKLGRAISVLAGYAMRPQLAMAALLLLMIGSSLLFLNAGPTEAAKDDAPPIVAEPAPPGESDGAPVKMSEAMALYDAGDFEAAEKAFTEIAARGDAEAPRAALLSAQSLRNRTTCEQAVAAFDDVARHYAESVEAVDARFRAANCRRKMGDVEAARRDYDAIAKDPRFGEGARTALSEMDAERQADTSSAVASRKSAPSKTRTAAKAKAGKKAKASAGPANAKPVRSKEHAAPADLPEAMPAK